MSSTPPPVLRHENDVAEEAWNDARGRLSFRTLIDGDKTATTALTFGTATIAPGDWLSLHRHAQPEIYYILSGTGVMKIDGVRHDVSAGMGIFIPGDAEHGITNAGTDTLSFLYAFAVNGFSEVVYRFS
jgi:mannose-6-phosphate isomerase-like protein (cupin superfamily)